MEVYYRRHQRRSHMFLWKNMMKVSFQRDKEDDARHVAGQVRITRIHCWVSRLRCTQLQTLVGMTAETNHTGFLFFKQFT